MVRNRWFLFKDCLDKKVCNDIKSLGKNNWEDGVITAPSVLDDGDNKSLAFENNKETRSSSVSWVNSQWLYDIVWPYMETANKSAGWEYDIVSAEAMQVARYRKNGFYSWHCDGIGDNLSAYNKPDNEFLHNRVRKLSMSILLNDNYRGGDFQFLFSEQGKRKTETVEINKAGSVIVFPSYLEHRVTSITKGIRYSLVVWFLGPPFK
jgi:PKHD-type hydroxylase